MLMEGQNILRRLRKTNQSLTGQGNYNKMGTSKPFIITAVFTAYLWFKLRDYGEDVIL